MTILDLIILSAYKLEEDINKLTHNLIKQDQEIEIYDSARESCNVKFIAWSENYVYFPMYVKNVSLYKSLKIPEKVNYSIEIGCAGKYPTSKNKNVISFAPEDFSDWLWGEDGEEFEVIYDHYLKVLTEYSDIVSKNMITRLMIK